MRLPRPNKGIHPSIKPTKSLSPLPPNRLVSSDKLTNLLRDLLTHLSRDPLQCVRAGADCHHGFGLAREIGGLSRHPAGSGAEHLPIQTSTFDQKSHL